MDQDLAQKLLEKTKSNFNRIASEFSHTRRYLWPELVNLFRGYIKYGESVLDIGCGNGRLLDLYIGMIVDYVGIDNSEKQIEEAIKRYPNRVFLTGDALNLPFSENYFDKVFSIAVLHEIPSSELRKKFLQEAKRVLKDNGLIFLTVWDLRNRKLLSLKYSFLRLIKRSGLDKGDVFIRWGREVERYYHVFGEKEIRKLVKEAGFDIIEMGVAKKEKSKKANIYLVAKKSSLSL